ncbi:MAG: hypothetical protein QOG64_1179 [Acidimicrobiaceae bacterium]|nr:hypothetical protein [Acidimicrobiaceae bacterium]
MTPASGTALPTVSVVIPMLNEKGFIEACLDSFDHQTYPHGLLDVVVVDGGSTDGSRAYVAAAARRHTWLRLVDNWQRRIPIGCNVGLAAARGSVVCFFSAHGLASPSYIERSVAVLLETGAAGVGGVYRHEGLGPASTAIGAAMSSPVGMASTHRFAAARREVDTASHPAYLTAAVRAAGGFDPALERNEDYELNWRIRAAGGRLVFDPSIVSTYRPRGSLADLARQFWWYGRWKAKVIAKHPGSVAIRHCVPPLAVAAAGTAPVLLGHKGGRRAVILGAMSYGALIGIGWRRARKEHAGADPLVLAAAFPTMHAAWGAGFLTTVMSGGPSWLRGRRGAIRIARHGEAA